MSHKLYIISLGCPKTRVDTEFMLGLLRNEGWELTHDPALADAILVSSCAFLQSSIEETIDTILEMADYKAGRCKKLVVAGCLPSRFEKEMAELKSSLPEVDAFLTTFQFADIVKVLHLPKAPEVVYPDPFLQRDRRTDLQSQQGRLPARHRCKRRV